MRAAAGNLDDGSRRRGLKLIVDATWLRLPLWKRRLPPELALDAAAPGEYDATVTEREHVRIAARELRHVDGQRDALRRRLQRRGGIFP